MLGKTHIINSLAITSAPLVFIDELSLTVNYIIFMIFVAIGSIIPDIDEPNSILGRKFIVSSTTINIFFGHRTITHNLLLFSITLVLLLRVLVLNSFKYRNLIAYTTRFYDISRN
ncbi:metal-dependent hydrolase [Aliarcobacter skirrowii]|uniref:metal-dependent hydrolase n=1 Tax=Aliarcobacter skirrowii TaxID=28200 RepID=UPI000F661A4A|nr:metal-dependent hydrolase [Aliarcobacter skirrowii]